MGATNPGDRAAQLMTVLGLSEDELCTILDTDALSLLSGQASHPAQLAILMALIEQVEPTVGGATLRRWVRAAGPAGRPIDALMRRDFAAFEDAIEQLGERGFVIGGGERSDAPERDA